MQSVIHEVMKYRFAIIYASLSPDVFL